MPFVATCFAVWKSLADAVCFPAHSILTVSRQQVCISLHRRLLLSLGLLNWCRIETAHLDHRPFIPQNHFTNSQYVAVYIKYIVRNPPKLRNASSSEAIIVIGIVSTPSPVVGAPLPRRCVVADGGTGMELLGIKDEQMALKGYDCWCAIGEGDCYVVHGRSEKTGINKGTMATKLNNAGLIRGDAVGLSWRSVEWRKL